MDGGIKLCNFYYTIKYTKKFEKICELRYTISSVQTQKNYVGNKGRIIKWLY